MKPFLQKISLFISSVVLVCFMLSGSVYASYEICGTCQVQTDTGAAGAVKFLDYSYVNNTYLSLRDMAMILKDTGKSFSLEITNNLVSMELESSYVPVGIENAPWESEDNPNLSLRRNDFEVGEQEMFYHTMIMKLPSGDYDCFMMVTDLAMLLDIDIAASDTDTLFVNTGESFHVSPEALEQAGYFYGVNSALVGDALTGEIYYQYQADLSYPIASTSKLMTCLMVMDALAAGQI